MRELALFAGAGGGILGGHLLGWRTVCAVEYNTYAASVLLARQNDGMLPPFPIWDDVRTFDGRPWRGIVDVVSGGFPCQDISCAGKGAGIDGERSGLWAEMARIIGEVRPRFVFVENSPMLVNRGLGRVLGDLSTLGYDAQWGVVSAADTGAPHKRERIWIVANAGGERCDNWRNYRQGRQVLHDKDGNAAQGQPKWQGRLSGIGEAGSAKEFPDSGGKGLQGSKEARDDGANRAQPEYEQFAGRCGVSAWRDWPLEPAVGRVVDGMAHRVDRIKALGNGQVPRVAATAFDILRGGV